MSEEIKRYQCRHIFTDGRRCGSPCLRHEDFCYHHHTTRKPIANLTQRRETHNRAAAFDLPEPEDRSAIQLSIGEVLRRVASNNIDPRRAGLLLYGLQIASLNLPKQKEAEASNRGQFVEEIVSDPTLGNIAPVADFTNPKGEKTLEDILNEQWNREQVLDTLQAVATPTEPSRNPNEQNAEPKPCVAIQNLMEPLAQAQSQLRSLAVTLLTPMPRIGHTSNKNRQAKQRTCDQTSRNQVIPIEWHCRRVAGRKPGERVRIHIAHPDNKVAKNEERRRGTHHARRHAQNRRTPQNLVPQQANAGIPGPRNQITRDMEGIVIRVGRQAEIRHHQGRYRHSTLPPRAPSPKEQQTSPNCREVHGGYVENGRKKAA
jgi:hypothetical protein